MGTKLLIFAGLLILFATGTGLTLTYLFGRKEEKRKSLSDTLKMYDTTPKKSFFLKREFVSAKETLVDTDQAGEIPRLIVKCVIGVTIGIFAAFVLFGSILLAVIFASGTVEDMTGGFGANGLAGVNGSPVAGLVVEIVLTFIFVLTILGVTSEKAGHGSFGGLVIGLTLVRHEVANPNRLIHEDLTMTGPGEAHML